MSALQKDIPMDTHVSSISQSSQSEVHTIRFLALDAIEPSSTSVQQQRRSHYDARALKELAENIKSFQVIEPIVVRPKPAGEGDERFELVAGERRWLASGQAGLESIPAIVRALEDREVLEIQLIENLHREGLHELEEAEGYESLMRDHHYGVDELVAKLGRSRAYVYARLKLLALNKKCRKAFYEGKLSAATALLLARIPVATLQLEALKAITETYSGEPMPLRDAQRHIQDRYMTRLKDAPFDVKVQELVAGVGACGGCPKLTGNQPELFGDVKGADLCMLGGIWRRSICPLILPYIRFVGMSAHELRLIIMPEPGLLFSPTADLPETPSMRTQAVWSAISGS
jgi:ParB/RepB/Spo0J family partition protein